MKETSGTKRELRVLIVEDSEDDALLLADKLYEGNYIPSYKRVQSAEALIEALDQGEWEIVFADYTMPRFSGTDALRIIRERAIDVPFLFVSGTIGEDIAVAAMRAGAQDYIMKSSLNRLLPAVERELREARLRRESTEAALKHRTTEAHFHNILKMAPDAVITVDEYQRIVLFSRGAEHIFGYSFDEIAGKPLDTLIPERYANAHRRHIKEFSNGTAASRRMDERAEIYGLRKDGSEFPAEASISKLTHGGTTTFTVILRDVSERKRAEEEINLLQNITRAVSEASDLHAALAVTLERVCATTSWLLAQAWVPSPDQTTIECSPAWCCRAPGLEQFRTASLSFAFAPGEGLPGRVWATREPLWLRDVTHEVNFPRAPFARDAGFKGAMGIPVLAGGQIVAVLEFFVREVREEDARLIELVSAVAAQLGTVFQRKRTEDRLQYLAHHDALTGLPNRALFRDRLGHAINDANRHGRLLSVAFLDLDRFKTINDSLGHGMGDLLLKAVADRLGRYLREGDSVARLSGDEFALILADMGHVGDAARVARKLLDSFAQPFHIAGHELFTNASLGITLYPHDDDSADGLLRNADIAMYRAKEAGGNTYQFFVPDMTATAHARLSMENALHRALVRDEFLLHYQPVIEIKSGRIVSIEALIRWQHPERGLVSPAEFIPLAEETGLILSLGEWVLRNACHQCESLRRYDDKPLRVAVNVSPLQLQKPDLADAMIAYIKKSRFDATRLEYEITENLLMQNSDSVVMTMYKLHEMGIQFSIDDFGTGYSSLSYLKRLPIGRLKIDQSFVRDIPGDLNDTAIVTAIISMAHNLGMQVVAEGVETVEQLAFLRERGCDLVQGHYFSPPVPVDQIAAALLADRSPTLPPRGEYDDNADV